MEKKAGVLLVSKYLSDSWFSPFSVSVNNKTIPLCILGLKLSNSDPYNFFSRVLEISQSDKYSS